MFERFIAAVLHRANSYPHWIDKDAFCRIKERILRRYGTRDGFDVQHIHGKQCWSCDGCGVFEHYSGDRESCWKCGGDGWFKNPVWVKLLRYQLGRFVFHTPVFRTHYEADVETWGEPHVTLEGYVTHRDYSYGSCHWSHLAIGAMFDWDYAQECITKMEKASWLTRVTTRRCLDCKNRLWSTKKWRCGVCKRAKAALPDEVPF